MMKLKQDLDLIIHRQLSRSVKTAQTINFIKKFILHISCVEAMQSFHAACKHERPMLCSA